MFKAIGFLLAVYVCYAVVVGRVVAKAGASAREVQREESPGYFWVVVGIYAGLSLALVTVF
jgi:muconolactone delta-isomerase